MGKRFVILFFILPLSFAIVSAFEEPAVSDMVSPDIISSDILSSDMVSSEILSSAAISFDILFSDMFTSDVMSPDVMSTDVISSDMIFFDDELFSGDEYQPEGGEALNELMKTLIARKTFDASAYGLLGNYEIVEEISGSLEEDKAPDRIRLVALRRDGGVFDRGLFLEVIPMDGDGTDGVIIPLPDDVQGFQSSIALKNFTSAKKSEVLLTINNGRRGDRFLAIEVEGMEGKVILDTQANPIPLIAGRFLNDFRAEIAVRDTGARAVIDRAIIDLLPRRAAYLRLSVYNERGTLLRGLPVRPARLSQFEPTDTDGDGILEIKEIIDMSGTSRSDVIAFVEATLNYFAGEWFVTDAWIAPFKDLNKVPEPIRIN